MCWRIAVPLCRANLFSGSMPRAAEQMERMQPFVPCGPRNTLACIVASLPPLSGATNSRAFAAGPLPGYYSATGCCSSCFLFLEEGSLFFLQSSHHRRKIIYAAIFHFHIRTFDRKLCKKIKNKKCLYWLSPEHLAHSRSSLLTHSACGICLLAIAPQFIRGYKHDLKEVMML